jgi:hypothetical protein
MKLSKFIKSFFKLGYLLVFLEFFSGAVIASDENQNMSAKLFCHASYRSYIFTANIVSTKAVKKSCKNIDTGYCDAQGGCNSVSYEKSCKVMNVTLNTIEVVQDGGASDPKIFPVGKNITLQSYISTRTYNPLGWGEKSIIYLGCKGGDYDFLYEPIFLSSNGDELIAGILLSLKYSIFFRNSKNYQDISDSQRIPLIKYAELPANLYSEWAIPSGIGIKEGEMYKIKKMVPLKKFKEDPYH